MEVVVVEVVVRVRVQPVAVAAAAAVVVVVAVVVNLLVVAVPVVPALPLGQHHRAAGNHLGRVHGHTEAPRAAWLQSNRQDTRS